MHENVGNLQSHCCLPLVVDQYVSSEILSTRMGQDCKNCRCAEQCGRGIFCLPGRCEMEVIEYSGRLHVIQDWKNYMEVRWFKAATAPASCCSETMAVGRRKTKFIVVSMCSRCHTIDGIVFNVHRERPAALSFTLH